MSRKTVERIEKWRRDARARGKYAETRFVICTDKEPEYADNIAVLRCGTPKCVETGEKTEEEYYEELKAALTDEVGKHFYTMLMQRDISGFDPNKIPEDMRPKR